MNWFVIHPNGQRYGPADATELGQWLEEKRAKRDTVVEESTTGARSTVAEVLGLAPEVVEPDLSLHTTSEEAPTVDAMEWPPFESSGEDVSAIGKVDQPVEIDPSQVKFSWPTDTEAEFRSEIGETREPETPEPVTSPNLGRPGQTVEALVKPMVAVVEAESIDWTPKKGPAKMSKAKRTGYVEGGNPGEKGGPNPQTLVGLSFVITTVGFMAACCIPVPLAGFFIANAAQKRGAKGAKAAKIYALIMLAVTILYWIVVPKDGG